MTAKSSHCFAYVCGVLFYCYCDIDRQTLLTPSSLSPPTPRAHTPFFLFVPMLCCAVRARACVIPCSHVCMFSLLFSRRAFTFAFTSTTSGSPHPGVRQGMARAHGLQAVPDPQTEPVLVDSPAPRRQAVEPQQLPHGYDPGIAHTYLSTTHVLKRLYDVDISH